MEAVGKHFRTGQPVQDEHGREVCLPSEMENAKAGAFLRFMAARSGQNVALSEHERELCLVLEPEKSAGRNEDVPRRRRKRVDYRRIHDREPIHDVVSHRVLTEKGADLRASLPLTMWGDSDIFRGLDTAEHSQLLELLTKAVLPHTSG